MSFFSNLFLDLVDVMFAPPCAFDSHSGGHDPSLGFSTPTQSTNGGGTDTGADWHNTWGTQADYQSPAESGNMFSSNDLSSGYGGSTFGNDW